MHFVRLIPEYKYTEVGNVCGVDVFLVPNIGKEGLIGEHFSPAWLVQELDEKLEKPQKKGVPQESTMVIKQREVARSLARSILRLFSYHVGNRLISYMAKSCFVVFKKDGLVFRIHCNEKVEATVKYQKQFLGKKEEASAKINMFFLTVKPDFVGQKCITLTRDAIHTVQNDASFKMARNRMRVATGKEKAGCTANAAEGTEETKNKQEAAAGVV